MVEGSRKKSMVAEVAVVDWEGVVVYHTYIQPTGPVVDYREAISGITPEKLEGAPPLAKVQDDLVHVLDGSVLIGHALDNDLRALGIRYTPVRNTAKHPFFQTLGPRGQLQPRKLAALYANYVGNGAIQQGAHGAVEDAMASMRVYRFLHDQWNAPVVHEGPMLNRK
jgi:RNA exonuclease 4